MTYIAPIQLRNSGYSGQWNRRILPNTTTIGNSMRLSFWMLAFGISASMYGQDRDRVALHEAATVTRSKHVSNSPALPPCNDLIARIKS
jgi:hypothetical protein